MKNFNINARSANVATPRVKAIKQSCNLCDKEGFFKLNFFSKFFDINLS